MSDEVEYNPFFKALQEQFSETYEKAQAECCTICIPQAASLPPAKISADFVAMHILSPSPYFTGQYVPWNRPRDDMTVYDIEGGAINGIEGFNKPFSVRILSEELGYNKKYEPFKILILEQPLDPLLNPSLQFGTMQSILRQGKLTSSDYRHFLRSDIQACKVLDVLNREVATFNRNYVIVKGYLDQTASRLESLCKQGLQVRVYPLNESLYEVFKHANYRVDQRMLAALQLAVECYVLAGVHDKVFHFVKSVHEQQDVALLSLCKRYTGITPKALGVEQCLCCKSPEAVVELAALDTHITPLDKLICMKETLEHITESVKTCASEYQSLEQDTIPSLASDDLIPLLVVVIVQAKCGHLPSSLSYCEMFHLSTSSKAELGYTLVTFQAAVHYLQDADLSKIIPEESEEEVGMEINPQAAAVAARSHGKVLRSSLKQESKSGEGKARRSSSVTMDSVPSQSLPEGGKVEFKYKGRYSPASRSHVMLPDTIPHSQSQKELGGIVGALQGRMWADGTSGKLS